jgi:arylsulfatase
VFSADETTDVGRDTGTPVGSGYTTATSRFTGRIHRVQLDVGPLHPDHVVSPEERMRVAMARQ